MADTCWTHASKPPSGVYRFGKTFNAAKAGTTSSEAFYHAALEDFARTAALASVVGQQPGLAGVCDDGDVVWLEACSRGGTVYHGQHSKGFV